MSKREDNPEDLLTVKQAAERLNVSENTVRRWQYQGKLPFVKVGGWAVRYRRADLEALIRREDKKKKED